MKVLHLVKTSVGARWALLQVEVLVRLGIDVTVALPSLNGAAETYRNVGARVVEADLDFTATSPWRGPAAARRCRALIDVVEPDLIHSHFVSTTLAARFARRRVPIVFQVPGPLHLEHRFFASLDVRTAGRRDHWIGSCRWTCAEYVRRGVRSDRVWLSYYGSDVDRFACRTASRRALRGPGGCGPTTRLVGMVAHMYAPKRFLGQRRGLKGHEDFIDAIAILRARGHRVQGVIVGGPWAGAERYASALRRHAEIRCPRSITFTGPRSDVPGIYAELDVAVHPSLSENCGGAVESLAAGCPTIATNVGGLPDVVIDGETGWLVPPRSPERLADAMRDALADRDEARRRALEGQTLVRRLFDVGRTGREIASIYEQILSCNAERVVAREPNGWVSASSA